MAEAIGEASENFYRRTAFVKKSAVTAEKRNQIKINSNQQKHIRYMDTRKVSAFRRRQIPFCAISPESGLPCLHEQTFAGQQTANSNAVSCPSVSQRIGGREASPIRFRQKKESENKTMTLEEFFRSSPRACSGFFRRDGFGVPSVGGKRIRVRCGGVLCEDGVPAGV